MLFYCSMNAFVLLCECFMDAFMNAFLLLYDCDWRRRGPWRAGVLMDNVACLGYVWGMSRRPETTEITDIKALGRQAGESQCTTVMTTSMTL